MSLYLERSELFLCHSSSWKWFWDWTSQNETVGTNLILFVAGLYRLVKCQGCSLLGVCFSAVFIDSNTHPRQPPFCEIKMPNFSLASHCKVGSCFCRHLNFSSLFLSRGAHAGALAHKTSCTTDISVSPSSLVLPCRIQPEATDFYPCVAVLATCAIRSDSFPWALLCPIEFKFIIEILMMDHILLCFERS